MKTTPRSTLLRGLRAWLMLVVLGLGLGLGGGARAQGAGKDFDHLRTGFALSGAHSNARCESCHVGGVFKGTPRDCESCHSAGKRFSQGNVTKTAAHFPTQQSCDSCHNVRTFTAARMNHNGIVRGTCTSCHNGAQAPGKTPLHMRTTASCDSCHGTAGWRPATGFNHDAVVPGTCETCHNGSQAPGKGAGHTPYSLVAGGASATCDTCHKAGFRSWLPARLHGAITVVAQCATCHAAHKPNTTVHNGQTLCETCHRSTSTWAGAKVDHATFTSATNCTTCHNGTGASGKPATHIPSGSSNCINCHNTRSWANARTHGSTPLTVGCKSCHSGSYASQGAVGKPGNHIPENQLLNGAAMECNTCHKSTASWNSTMDHNGSLGGGAGWCKGCHATGTSYAGSLERKAVTHQKKTPPAIDCSESGCHRPLGNKGSTYRNWD